MTYFLSRSDPVDSAPIYSQRCRRCLPPPASTDITTPSLSAPPSCLCPRGRVLAILYIATSPTRYYTYLSKPPVPVESNATIVTIHSRLTSIPLISLYSFLRDPFRCRDTVAPTRSQLFFIISLHRLTRLASRSGAAVCTPVLNSTEPSSVLTLNSFSPSFSFLRSLPTIHHFPIWAAPSASLPCFDARCNLQLARPAKFMTAAEYSSTGKCRRCIIYAKCARQLRRVPTCVLT